MMNLSSVQLNSNYTSGELIVLVSFFSIFWILVVMGNTLVIIAIAVDRGLKSVQNWFLASLGLADLLLGLLILPLSFTKDILGYWIFGGILCSLWLAIDVLLSTASIMNLCLISLDRYWSISRPLTYINSRTPTKAGLMIMAAWLISAVICLPPLLGWSKPQKSIYTCELTDDKGYVFYSAIGSFYIPLSVILIVYSKVFYSARNRIRRRPGDSLRKHISFPLSQTEGEHAPLGDKDEQDGKQESPDDKVTAADNNQLHCNGSNDYTQTQNSDDLSRSSDNNWSGCFKKIKSKNKDTSTTSGCDNQIITLAEKKKKLQKSRERRATLVLGIILGAFIICWFPFFTTYIIDILCNCVNKHLFTVFFWMGYCNSALNPIIYTVFNKDFRKAFRNLLICRTCTTCF